MRVLGVVIGILAVLGGLAYALATGNLGSKRESILGVPFTTKIEKVWDNGAHGDRYYEIQANLSLSSFAGSRILDVGDVRVAFRGHAKYFDWMTFGITIDRSDSAEELATYVGTQWIGGGPRGMTITDNAHGADVTLGELNFAIHRSVMDIAGVKVPIGQGRTVVFVSSSGVLEEIVKIDETVASVRELNAENSRWAEEARKKELQRKFGETEDQST